MNPTSAPAPHAIEVERLTKTYTIGTTVHAVDGVSLNVPHGSFTAVMGPSGSGKSTLMQLIGLLDAPTSGRLTVNGRDVEGLADEERTRLRGKEIGFVFQSFNLMPKLTVLGNVTLPMQFQGVAARERLRRAEELLARMGMSDRLHHKPNQLSGGERQRVAIARALLRDPRLILCDEPTGNLDARTGMEIIGLFRDLNRRGITLLMVTHEARVARAADRVLRLVDGGLQEVSVAGDLDETYSAAEPDTEEVMR